jgi:uridine kinase
MNRQEVIKSLVNSILDIKVPHPVRVGISGITASGKTTLANELASEMQSKGKRIIRTSFDYFHNPKHIRYRQGKASAIGYYEDAHDYTSFLEKLLFPLGPLGNLRYQPSSFDLEKDEPILSNNLAKGDDVLIVDGTFLFKRELIDQFDFKIFVETDFDLARARGAKREEKAFGSILLAEEMFRKRYHAASKLYLDEHTPRLIADAIVNNDDLENPVLQIINR